MKNSKAVKAGRRGQFTKGDPRINRTNGPLSNEAKSWGIGVKNALAQKIKPEEYADLLLKYARLGRPWAVLEIGERLIGKEEQPISGAMTLRFKFGDNGNGS